MFNWQTKRTIVALLIYPETPPCRVFLGGPGHRIFVCLHNCAIPHNSCTISVFYRTICLPKRAKNFFPRILSEGLFNGIQHCLSSFLDIEDLDIELHTNSVKAGFEIAFSPSRIHDVKMDSHCLPSLKHKISEL